MLSARLAPRPSQLRPVLDLPPSLRTSIYTRQFHASPRRHYVPILSETLGPYIHSATELTTSGMHTLLTTVHSCGLPWAYTIPLTALLIRLAIVPLLTLPARRAQQRRLNITPLYFASMHPLRLRAVQEAEKIGLDGAKRHLLAATQAHQRALEKDYKCGWRWRSLPLLQAPILLTMAESIRRMVGTDASLLGLLAQSVLPREDPGVPLADVLKERNAPWIEPSMETEGFLWAPSLAAADPFSTLPFVVSGVLFFDVWRSTTLPGMPETTGWRKGLKWGLLSLCLIIGPISLKFPTAVLVYWLSSATTGMLSKMAMDWWLPLKPPPKRLKRFYVAQR